LESNSSVLRLTTCTWLRLIAPIVFDEPPDEPFLNRTFERIRRSAVQTCWMRSEGVMNDKPTLSVAWLLAGVATVTILFNGIALALALTS
jgi:hypothetical protein